MPNYIKHLPPAEPGKLRFLGLWVLWARAGIVFQLAGRRPPAVAALRRSLPPRRCRHRCVADAAMDRRALLHVRCARSRACGVWPDQRRRGQIRRVVRRFGADAGQRRDIKALVAGKVIECGASLLATARILFSSPVITTRRPALEARYPIRATAAALIAGRRAISSAPATLKKLVAVAPGHSVVTVTPVARSS